MTDSKPVDWLRRFKDAGGWYAVQVDKVHAGWRLDDLDQAAAAREIWRELEESPELRAAVRSFLTGGAEEPI